MNILITGITGSLGRALCNNLINNSKYNIFGIYNSEQKYSFFKRNTKYNNIKCFKQNITDSNLENNLNHILYSNKINYIIHSAAMKHVDICEDNIILAIQTNILATDIIIRCALKNNITNLIAISTDKSLEPCNIYGYSKLIMQKLVLNNGYSIYQGANFFWSDGSVLDVWTNQMNNKQKLTVTSYDHKRYFNSLDYVSEILVKNLDNKSAILIPEHVYLIKMKDMLDAFMEFYKYDNYIIIGKNKTEKIIENIDDIISNRITLSKKDLINLIKNHYS
jgi:FlaA1/EpsC-like NDP-sugar epimerase